MFDVFTFGDPTDSDATFGGGDVNFSPQDATILQGNGNSLPVQTDTDYQGVSSVLQKLGSIDYVKTARDLGTAVGTVRNTAAQIGPAFSNAQAQAASGNSLGTWWQYASTTDKLVVGLAAATLVFMLAKG